MRPKYLIVILFLLTAAGAGQLAPDKERFDVVLHPGDLEERTLVLTNTGDAPIYEISNTDISGSASDFIFLAMPEEMPLMPQDKAEIKIYFALPLEAKPGTYSGYIYLLDSTPPTLPTRIDFNILAIAQESYDISMTIDDAKSASLSANSKDIAQFELAVKNLGSFRDVASIDAGPLPEGWELLLLDGEEELSFPYNLSLDPGSTHKLFLQVTTSNPGYKSNATIIATSIGNKSRNDTVRAEVDFAAEVRGYSVSINIPDRIVVNKTYKGSFQIMLDVEEKVIVAISTPTELMVMPIAQVVDVTPQSPGTANFTMLASESGEYPIVFQSMDTNGIAMPAEMTYVNVIVPEGVAVLTGDDLTHSTIASAAIMGNGSVAAAVISVPYGKLEQKDQEILEEYATVLILGNDSIVSADAEKELQVAEVKRIQSGSIYEDCWQYASELWQNGTAGVILAGSSQADIFRAYQAASMTGMPIIICDGNATSNARSLIKEMAERDIALSSAYAVTDIGEEYIRSLEDAGIAVVTKEEMSSGSDQGSDQNSVQQTVQETGQIEAASYAMPVIASGNATPESTAIDAGGMAQ